MMLKVFVTIRFSLEYFLVDWDSSIAQEICLCCSLMLYHSNLVHSHFLYEGRHYSLIAIELIAFPLSAKPCVKLCLNLNSVCQYLPLSIIEMWPSGNY